MFKKAFLSTLVSVFLTLSIFTIATAFGATTPTGNPPNGLASPTFGGLTVNGDITSDTGAVYVNDDFLVKGFISLDEYIVTTDRTALDVLDGLNVMGPTTVQGNLTIFGNLKNNSYTPFTINDDLSLTGKLTATSIGTYTVRYGVRKSISPALILSQTDVSVSAPTITLSPNSINVSTPLPKTFNFSATATKPTTSTTTTSVYAPFPVSATATCNTNEILVNCGINSYSDQTTTTPSGSVLLGRVTLNSNVNNSNVNPTSCVVSGINPSSSVTQYFAPYALCFNPNL